MASHFARSRDRGCVTGQRGQPHRSNSDNGTPIGLAAAHEFRDTRNASPIDRTIAAVELTRNMVGATHAFACAFMDAGPSGEAITVEESRV